MWPPFNASFSAGFGGFVLSLCCRSHAINHVTTTPYVVNALHIMHNYAGGAVLLVSRGNSGALRNESTMRTDVHLFAGLPPCVWVAMTALALAGCQPAARSEQQGKASRPPPTNVPATKGAQLPPGSPSKTQ